MSAARSPLIEPGNPELTSLTQSARPTPAPLALLPATGTPAQVVPMPLVLPALVLALGVAVAERASASTAVLLLVSLLLAGACAVGACVSRPNSRPRRALVATTPLCLMFLIGAARLRVAIEAGPDDISAGLTSKPVLAQLEGQVISNPLRESAVKRNPFTPIPPRPQTRFLLRVTAAARTPLIERATGLIRVDIADDRVEVEQGDTLRLTGWMARPHAARNPGEPDWVWWSRVNGVRAILRVEDPALVQRMPGSGPSWAHAVAWFREQAQRRMLAPAAAGDSERERGLLDAMVLGQRMAVDRAVDTAFRRTGTIHFLSVSGFHVALLASICAFFMRRLIGASPRTSAGATAIVILAYTILAEPNSPILRAALMGLLGCACVWLGRPLASLNWLALSAIVLLIASPLQLFDPGFQLSFVQVAGLLMLAGAMQQRKLARSARSLEHDDAKTWSQLIVRETLRFAGISLTVATFCWALAAPLALYHFGQFAPWAPLQSLIITPLVSLVTVSGFAVMLLNSVVVTPLAAPAAGLEALTRVLLSVVDRLAQWPYTLIQTPPPHVSTVLLSYLALGCAAVLLHRARAAAAPRSALRRARDAAHALRRSALQRRVGIILLVGCPMAWLSWGFWPAASQNGYQLHVLAVGDGSALLAVGPDRRAAVFDAGTLGNRDVGELALRSARWLGVESIDWLTVSHANLDHFSGVGTLLDAYPAIDCITTAHVLEQASRDQFVARGLHLEPRATPWRTLRAGDRLNALRAHCDVLWPPDDLPADWDANDRSLVLRLSAHGRHVLIPGDISRRALRALLERHAARTIDLRSDVLIAPHHGAIVGYDSEVFYRAVNPEVVVASTARDRAALEELVRKTIRGDVPLFVTGRDGAVRITIRPDCSLDVDAPWMRRDDSGRRD